MIDIIIPCYKAKKTLTDTLFSVMYQTFKDYKVYLVNDGSGYDYHEEVDFFKNFMDITEMDHSPNRGPAYARNRGYEASHGDFVVYLDSDDTFASPNSLELLYKKAIEKNADLVISKYKQETNEDYLFYPPINVSTFGGKLFRRKFLEDNKILAIEEIIGGEDTSYNQLVIECEPKIEYYDIVTLIYRNNVDSITRKDNESFKKDKTTERTFVVGLLWTVREAKKRGKDEKHLTRYLIAWAIQNLDHGDYKYMLENEQVRNAMTEYKQYMEEYNITYYDILKEEEKIFEYDGSDNKCILEDMIDNFYNFLGGNND